MAKTSMAMIARIIGEVAQLDRHGRQVVRDYLEGELSKPVAARKTKVTTYEKGVEK